MSKAILNAYLVAILQAIAHSLAPCVLDDKKVVIIVQNLPFRLNCLIINILIFSKTNYDYLHMLKSGFFEKIFSLVTH